MENLTDHYGKTIKVGKLCSRYNMGYWSDGWTVVHVEPDEDIVSVTKSGHGILGNFSNEIWMDEPVSEFFHDELI